MMNTATISHDPSCPSTLYFTGLPRMTPRYLLCEVIQATLHARVRAAKVRAQAFHS